MKLYTLMLTGCIRLFAHSASQRFLQEVLPSLLGGHFEKFWNEAGADFVVVRKLHSAAGAKNKIKDKMDLILTDIDRKPCLYPWERLVLTPEGDLGFCPAGWTGESHFIKFKDTTIKEAWQSDFMDDLRKAHLDNNFTCFGFCDQCPDWVNTKWPEEQGVNYSDMMSEIVPSDLL